MVVAIDYILIVVVLIFTIMPQCMFGSCCIERLFVFCEKHKILRIFCVVVAWLCTYVFTSIGCFLRHFRWGMRVIIVH